VIERNEWEDTDGDENEDEDFGSVDSLPGNYIEAFFEMLPSLHTLHLGRYIYQANSVPGQDPEVVELSVKVSA
jgi:hypothetical protein